MNVRIATAARAVVVLFALAFIGSLSARTLYWFEDKNFMSQLDDSIKSFVGDARGDYFLPDASVATDLIEAIHGLPHSAYDINGNLKLLTASVPQAGLERAAIVVDANGQVAFAGLVSAHCSKPKQLRPEQAARLATHPDRIAVACTRNLWLTIFTRTTLPDDVRKAYEAWVAKSFYPTTVSQNKVNIEVRVLD